jgi:carbamoyltransferase
MIVLGINDGHDAGICLMRDGEVVLVSNEERRINKKNAAGVPTESLKVAFARTGISPKDVDRIALSSMIRTTVPVRDQSPTVYTALTSLYSLGRTEWGTRFGRWLLPKLRKRADLLSTLADMGLADKTVQGYDHHLCHAATAHYHRPWDGPSTVLTLDGAGDGLCATVNVGRDDAIEVKSQTPKFHSPAAGLYSAITGLLGMRPSEHEYKIMGMAPYGQASYSIDAIRPAFSVEGLTFRNHTGKFGPDCAKYFHKRLFKHRFDNICAATQQAFEEMMLQWVKNAIGATGINRITAAGGAFLNVKANKLIREMSEVDALYVYPASDDGGTPVGAAILAYLDLCKAKGVAPKLNLPKSMYQGLSFNDAEMETAIKASGLNYHRMPDPADEVGGLVAAGKIVARFDGQEELGPRSLGNRAIIADPRDLRFVRKLNFAIKQRDFWMPFAASILEEDAEKYLVKPTKWAHHMIEAFDSTPEGGETFVAGSHPFDRTIRPQLVNELNPGYRDVIRAFKKRTGVGGVLNTSFNLHGSPIVGTPEIALYTLVNSELDCLAMGPFLVANRSRQ